MRSPRKTSPTSAVDTGRNTMKTPALAALTCCRPFIQSQTVTVLAAIA